MAASIQVLPNSQTINYYETGVEHANKGPTLLFIHGNFSNWMWWTETINVLKKQNYHIIAVDLRGFGNTSYNNKCHYFKDWANDLVDFCKLKHIKECVAIGWSFGGGVSMKLAQLIPQVVKKVVLTCSVSHQGLTLFNKEVPCKTYQQINKNVKVQFMQSIIETNNRQAFVQVFQSILLTHAKNYSIQQCQPMIDGSMKQKCYTEVIFALANSDINISLIKAKVLMLHGKFDNVVTLKSVESTGQYFKNFVVWENNAHMIPIENIQGYAQLVKKFIEDK